MLHYTMKELWAGNMARFWCWLAEWRQFWKQAQKTVNFIHF